MTSKRRKVRKPRLSPSELVSGSSLDYSFERRDETISVSIDTERRLIEFIKSKPTSQSYFEAFCFGQFLSYLKYYLGQEEKDVKGKTKYKLSEYQDKLVLGRGIIVDYRPSMKGYGGKVLLKLPKIDFVYYGSRNWLSEVGFDNEQGIESLISSKYGFKPSEVLEFDHIWVNIDDLSLNTRFGSYNEEGKYYIHMGELVTFTGYVSTYRGKTSNLRTKSFGLTDVEFLAGTYTDVISKGLDVGHISHYGLHIVHFVDPSVKGSGQIKINKALQPIYRLLGHYSSGKVEKDLLVEFLKGSANWLLVKYDNVTKSRIALIGAKSRKMGYLLVKPSLANPLDLAQNLLKEKENSNNEN